MKKVCALVMLSFLGMGLSAGQIDSEETVLFICAGAQADRGIDTGYELYTVRAGFARLLRPDVSVETSLAFRWMHVDVKNTALLETRGLGLTLEGFYRPFDSLPFLWIGAQWEVFSLNWVSDAEQNRFTVENPGLGAPEFFTSSGLSALLRMQFAFSQRLGLVVEGRIGISTATIGSGTVIGNTASLDGDGFVERFFMPYYGMRAGFHIRL